ncbi:uncharacterized protein Z519_01934 [Cladophialophora bantiana CBS 173.52]|uniref:Cation efflux protein transmembrane domain-containing protein n=1 Tax=Cladophialophora bantiana (strain ATCC 10958 / CBS 173.52 / CDC B-1940 / NIH 8579) TaxID=1442370 RepID=A0A0D2HSW2_CLAB1|nr:uncharacterized protein Z519_01934 [Cladophialophora bantiana CBS 173.52]KIW96543.1 hypothetical protein Z519_01934 [Cladophialophora bantiana CBS 173.52]
MCESCTIYHLCGHVKITTIVQCANIVDKLLTSNLPITITHQVCEDGVNENLHVFPDICEKCKTTAVVGDFMEQPGVKLEVVQSWAHGNRKHPSPEFGARVSAGNNDVVEKQNESDGIIKLQTQKAISPIDNASISANRPTEPQSSYTMRKPDLEAGNHKRHFPGFKDAVEYALDCRTTAVLKEQLRNGVDRGAFEKARKSDEERIEEENVRKFYGKQNATLNNWAEVDTIVLAMADEVMEGRLQHVEEHIHYLLPEEVRKSRQKKDRNARWAININVIANIILVVAKGIAALKSSSLSLIASLVDSAQDLLCTATVWATNKLVSWRLSALVTNFPVGRRRLEPIGILLFSIIMVISFLQVLQESIAKLLPNGNHDIASLPPLAIASMVETVEIKV